MFFRVGGLSVNRYESAIPLVVTMRVKNEERILSKSLESLRVLDCPVILLDDGSTDSTPEIASEFPYVDYHYQDLEMDELRDRGWLFRKAWGFRPEWVLTLDGDEVLPERTARKILAAIEHAPQGVNIIELAIAFMWGEDWYVNFEKGPFWHPRMYRMTQADLEAPFKPIEFATGERFKHGLHCGPLPPMRNPWAAMRVYGYIKAYGYDTEEDYRRHLDFYNEYDDTLWSQKQIVSRLLEPLLPWRDNEAPGMRSELQAAKILEWKYAQGMKIRGEYESGESKKDRPAVLPRKRVGPKGKRRKAGRPRRNAHDDRD